jgi:ankyrin repeat protein
LLQLAIDNDEVGIVRWLLDRGADPDARAAIDDQGFGGHTALFGTVVSQPYRVGLRDDDLMARLLLDRGADPGVRASLRKRLLGVEDESEHVYHDVTPLSWGERFHDQDWVNRAAMRLLAERGGRP